MVSASPVVHDAVVDYEGLGHQQPEARTSRKWRLGRRCVILATIPIVLLWVSWLFVKLAR